MNTNRLEDALNLNFLGHLVATPEGRAHLLAQVALGESAGESAVFEKLAALTDVPELQRLVRRHAADEVEHAALLNARVVELGVGQPHIPAELSVFDALERRLQVFSRPLERGDVLRAYVFLQVLEERAAKQFALCAQALREVDPISAALFARIHEDEVRHLKYCHAITQRYAANPDQLAHLLERFRAAEADAFGEVAELNLQVILERGLLGKSLSVQRTWRALTWVGSVVRRARPPRSAEGFEPTTTAEPHRLRRRELLARRPEVTALMGFDRRTILVTIVVAAAQLALAAFTSKLSWLLVVPLAYLVGSILSHWLGQSIHETSHRLAARTALANRVLAWFANVPMVLPIAETFHRYHLEHHSHLGMAGRDSDLPLPIEQTLVRGSLTKTLWLFFYPVVYFVRGAAYARRPSAAELLNIAFIALINVALWKVLGPVGFAYLALSTFFAHGLHPVAAHFIHEHYLFEGRQETTSYYGPLNWVTFNVGYHVEHHDFMNVPGWRLPELRALLHDEYATFASHQSWTSVLVEFIARADLGPRARLVRAQG